MSRSDPAYRTSGFSLSILGMPVDGFPKSPHTLTSDRRALEQLSRSVEEALRISVGCQLSVRMLSRCPRPSAVTARIAPLMIRHKYTCKGPDFLDGLSGCAPEDRSSILSSGPEQHGTSFDKRVVRIQNRRIPSQDKVLVVIFV